MSEKRSIGLVSIEIGDPAEDGGMAADLDLAVLGVTFQDSCELSQDEPEIVEINSEENDEPEEIIAGKTKKTLKWSIINVAPAALVKVLGGTVTGAGETEAWESPRTTVIIEKSIRIKTKTLETIDIVRARIVAKLNWKFSKKDVNKVDITAYVLVPLKANTPPIKKYATVVPDPDPEA
jgi:hypothetical protein